MRLRSFLPFVISLWASLNLSCAVTAGSGTSTLLNAFTRAGTALSIDDLTSGSETYLGRALIKNGGTLYGASLRFDLRKDSDTGAYFANFQILRLVILNGFTPAFAVVSSPLTLGLNSGLQTGGNELRVQNALERSARFSLNFSANAYVGDVLNAGLVVANDFRTLVGGDDGSFFFIAQKQADLEAVSVTDLNPHFTLVDFSVSSVGQLSFRDLWRFSAAGTGGSGLAAYRATTSDGGIREGEFKLVDADTGIFVFGEDSSPGGGTPTKDDSGADGGLLLSPDRSLLLSYNLSTSSYAAGGR